MKYDSWLKLNEGYSCKLQLEIGSLELLTVS